MNNTPIMIKKMILDPAVASNLRKYLIHVVNDPTGVGKKAAIPGYDIAGKNRNSSKGRS